MRYWTQAHTSTHSQNDDGALFEVEEMKASIDYYHCNKQRLSSSRSAAQGTVRTALAVGIDKAVAHIAVMVARQTSAAVNWTL